MSVPTKEQVARLVEAAWTAPITSIDATMYVSVTRPVIPREELEVNVRRVHTAVAKGIKQAKVILKISEKGEEQDIRLSIPFQVYRRIVLAPQTINLGEVSGSTVIDKTVQIKIAGDYDCRKIKAVSSVDTLRTEIIPLAGQQHTSIDGFVFANLQITGSILTN